MPDGAGLEPKDARQGRGAARGRGRGRPRGRRRARGQGRTRRVRSSSTRSRGGGDDSPCGSTASGRRGGRTIWRPVAGRRPDVVVLPKAESADHVRAVAELLPDGVGLEAQIESARGLVEVERIAAVGGPLEALVFGPGDFAASIGVPVLTIGDGALRLRARTDRRRGARVRAPGGRRAVRRDPRPRRARASAELALGARLRRQVGRPPGPGRAGERGLQPSEEELERARRILAAGEGATLVDGEMVDKATHRLAAALVARARG